MSIQKTTSKKFNNWWFRISTGPIIIYCAVILGIIVALQIKPYHEDLSLNLVSEIIGGAFILFVIDFLLVRSKTKRWEIVQKNIDYLISRNISRLRDGMTRRAFGFQPNINDTFSKEEVKQDISQQRHLFLNSLSELDETELSKKLISEFFSEENYDYFNEKADEIWNVLNMKYSEYLPPELVSLLMELHTHLKDVCAHIRLYKKSENFSTEKAYYKKTGSDGASHHLKESIRIVNRLKDKGYSKSVG
jgi:hypothetical protein